MKKKVTWRERFLAEMDVVVPFGRLLMLIEPHYPKVGPKGGRPPMPVQTMLRIYFLHNFCALSDPMAEENALGQRSDAPSSMKNKAKARAPEMSATKKRNDWFFGMKAHIGVDVDSGTVHSLDTTTTRVHDSQVWDELLYGDENSVSAGNGYVNTEREAAFGKEGKVWGVMRKAPKGDKLHPIDAQINRIIATPRCARRSNIRATSSSVSSAM